VPTWESWSYVFGPLTALVVVGLLVLTLRWAFGRGGSLVERRPRAGGPGEYGLLVPVATPRGPAEAEDLRRALEDGGVRATVTATAEGTRVLVFDVDAEAARRVLDARRRGG
jgi:hypothetical protein